MDGQPTICVTCAWRETCNKKFSMDGATTTRCIDYTRDLTLGMPKTQDADSEVEEAKSVAEEKR
ncbi:MAG: hypothetical protein FJ118_08230 [Deltaproteobacteria bacterium]|nr:hypothetical protein [Deltaproteobacteria bacterium]